VEDRWWNDVRDPATGKVAKVRTERHGWGNRYRVRYLDPEGRDRSVSFPDRQKKAADDFLLKVEDDKRQGAYIDPGAGRLRFGAFVSTWFSSQTFDASTRNSIRPTDVRAWIRAMQDRNVAASYQAGCFAHLSSIMSAAVDDKLIRETRATRVRSCGPGPSRRRWCRGRAPASRPCGWQWQSDTGSAW